MSQPYSQVKAMLAITKASFTSILRSPSAVVFSIAFPLIFILVFGFIGGGSRISLKISFDKRSDTTNAIYQSLKNVSGISIVREDEQKVQEDLEKGRLDGVVNIQKNAAGSPAYSINIKTSEAVN